MNERIRKLADKIWKEEYWDNPNTDKLLPAQLNRFAELIVRECADIVAKRKNQAIDDGWNVDEAMSMAEMDFLEHFGVEE